MRDHSLAHQHPLMELLMRLHGGDREGERGWVVSRVFVVLGPSIGVVPDLVYVSRERRNIISDRAVEGAPDLLVEVLTPRSDSVDRGPRMRVYAEAGVPHCWLLDLTRRALEIYELDAGAYRLLATYRANDAYEPELFPEVTINIVELFEWPFRAAR